MGGQPVSSIDLYGLYSIAESLPDERTGYFDYTFDDENDSLGDRVQAICNAASVVAYWDDGVLTFTRDQKVDYPAAVFNRANMKTDEYKMTYEATLHGGYDGVQVSYVHPTTNNKTYINYRVLNGAIVEQEAENPNKLEIVGFRNEYQARERALRETKRLIYSRVKMNAKVFEDGIIGSVASFRCPTSTTATSNRVTSPAAPGITDTSEPITFSGSMYVLVTDSWVIRRCAIRRRHAATRSTASPRHYPTFSSIYGTETLCSSVALSHCDSGRARQSAMDGQQHQTEHR